MILRVSTIIMRIAYYDCHHVRIGIILFETWFFVKYFFEAFSKHFFYTSNFLELSFNCNNYFDISENTMIQHNLLTSAQNSGANFVQY